MFVYLLQVVNMVDKAFGGEITVTSTTPQDDDDDVITTPYEHPSKLFTIDNNKEWIVSMSNTYVRTNYVNQFMCITW